MISILTIVGARPQFVKAAAVSRAIRETDGVGEAIVHTGQHFDQNMSDSFFGDLGIPEPAYNLAIAGGNHGQMTGRMLEGIEEILLNDKPDVVLVYGDTNSTLAGALAAAKLRLPVAHVEAGLRSYNRRMPEEINRVLADHVSDLLLCPTHLAVKNLASEGVTDGVVHVGDVMFDATLFAGAKARERSTILADMGLKDTPFALATVHRAENTDDLDRLKAVVAYLKKTVEDMPVVLPLHPRTRGALERTGISPTGVTLIDPVGYLDMHQLLSEASLVLTDSGGLQKEAYFHRTPCVTLRDETEWVETVDNGWNRLWHGPDYQPRGDIAEYGTGDASGACIREIRKLVG